MAYSFVVEDGTGKVNATSYVSTDEAEDYYAPDVNFSAAWAALDDDKKEAYLSWASRILDQKTTWRGTIMTSTQALRWPRYGAINRDSMTIDPDEIPEEVKAATCELVKYLQGNDPTTGPDTDNLKSLKVDVIEIAFQPKAVESNYPSILNQILSPLGVFRVGGAGFGRIVKA
jgi:hypothetical protein